MYSNFAKISLFLVFFLWSFVGSAQTETFYEWTGAVSSDWDLADNWDSGSPGLPDSKSNVSVRNNGVAHWPALTTNVSVGSLYMAPGTRMDTKGKQITVRFLSIYGTTIENSTPDSNTEFVIPVDAGIANSTFHGNTTFTYDCPTPLFMGGFQEGLGGPNHFLGNTTFIIKNVGGVFAVCTNSKSIFDGNVDVISANPATYTIFKSGAVVNGNFTLNASSTESPMLTGTVQIGSLFATQKTAISGTVNINNSSRFFYLTNINNATSGGNIYANNFDLELNANSLKVASFKGISARGRFTDNVIDGNLVYDMFAKGVDLTFTKNKIVGTSEFKIHYTSTFSGIQWAFDDSDNEYLNDVNYSFLKLNSNDKLQFKWNGSVYAKNVIFTDSTSVLLDIKANSLILHDYNKLIFKGAGVTQMQNIDPSWIIPNLSMEKASIGKLVLSTPLSVSNSLSFVGGIIESDAANPLILLDGAIVSGASNASHVKGTVNKIGNDAFTFPIGSGSKFAPVAISTPGSLTDVFSARYSASSPSGDGYSTELKATSLMKVYNKGYWDIKRTAGNSDVFVSLGYNLPDGYVTDQSKLRVAHWDGTKWEDLGNGGTDGSLTQGAVSTVAGVGSFSPFTIASTDGSNPLPVKLTMFSVHKEGRGALLQWRTTEEFNSDRFELEHSVNASNWQKLGEVKAKGDNKSLSQYIYTHETPFPGLNYYRLKMIDEDGSFAYSKIERLLSLSGTKTFIFPNPVSERLFIETTKGVSTLNAELTEALGRILFITYQNDIGDGIDLSKLTSGIYFLKINLSNGEKETHKVLVNR